MAAHRQDDSARPRLAAALLALAGMAAVAVMSAACSSAPGGPRVAHCQGTAARLRRLASCRWPRATRT